MNNISKDEIFSYITSLGLLLFLIIDPMGILTCKTGTCSISPTRELLGWALLYFSIAEVLFAPLIKFRKKLKLNRNLILLIMGVVVILEILFLRYTYLAAVILFTIVKHRALFFSREEREDVQTN